MANVQGGRQKYLRKNPHSRGWAALDEAYNSSQKLTHKPCLPPRNSLNGKRVIVIGSGVGGLTAGYELLNNNSNLTLTIVEANNRTGGRCLTLRTGDTFTEDKTSDLNCTQRGEPQVVRFERPVGDEEPYLNAGPGRIPSSHKRLLSYLKQFGVEVQLYAMNSDSNMSQMSQGPDGDQPVVNRRLRHNTRGWLAEMVYQSAEQLLGSHEPCQYATKSKTDQQSLADHLRSLMVSFGDLTSEGKYKVGTPPRGEDDDDLSTRAGYEVLPGVDAGVIAEAFDFNTLLNSKFWEKTKFYQPADFLWQPTLFQPVGGMDKVQHAFAQRIATLGGTIHLNSPVTKIVWDEALKQFKVYAAGHAEPFVADYCFCNLAMPFLEKILDPPLLKPSGFTQGFSDALGAVFHAQANSCPTDRFLACTTKVGWQADRCLWQGEVLKPCESDSLALHLNVSDSEVGVVPIFGGISWTENPITQIWYPSNGYHDVLGVLTGCYNFGKHAKDAGEVSIQQRLTEAREGARLFGDAFADGLGKGVAIAWQNMPYIKGGWAQWSKLGDSHVEHYNAIVQGSNVNGERKDNGDPLLRFFILGDQASSLPGWQEGAIDSAINALTRLADSSTELPYLSKLADPRQIVEGL